jgi:thiamine-phosphate pyrophosphorylase
VIFPNGFNDGAAPVIFYVTDRKSQPGASRAGLEAIRAAAAAKVDFVQIREKDLPTRELLQMIQEAVDLARESYFARIIVNDRLDVALAAGAAGVHLGRQSVPAAEAIEWCRSGDRRENFFVGVSCHSLEEAREAEQAGASYVFFGPVFDTPSKRSFGSPQGVELLRHLCHEVKIPVIAIGGVNESNAPDCIRAGAAGIAAIRMVQEANDVEALALKIERIHRLGLQR